MLQGTSLGNDSCSAASIDLWGQNDDCGRSLSALFFNDSNRLPNIANITKGDCPARYQAYVNGCVNQFGSFLDQVSIIILLLLIFCG